MEEDIEGINGDGEKQTNKHTNTLKKKVSKQTVACKPAALPPVNSIHNSKL